MAERETEAALMRPCSRCRGPKTGIHGAYCAGCYRAYKREWYAKHREQQVRRSADYNRRHPERAAANMRLVRARQGSTYLQHQRSYRAANREKYKQHDARKRALRKAAGAVARISVQAWESIKARFGYRCIYCGKRPLRLTMDHFVPLARGGAHHEHNIVPACHRCNSLKQHKDPYVFAAEQGRLVW